MNDGGNDGLEDWQCLMWPPQFLPIYKLLGDGLDGYRWQVPPRCFISVEDATSPLRSLSASSPASTSALGKLFGFIYPSIVQSVRKFKRIVEVNRQVHLLTYNRIISQEARKKTLAQQ